MRNTSLILNLVLAVAVAVIYVLHFSGKSSNESVGGNSSVATSNSDLKIAYVKVDSLILNYDLAEELHDSFTKNQEAYTKEYTEKRSSFEKRAAAFQEKVQRGGFLTQDLSMKLSEMQSANNKQLIDSLMNYLKEYNVNKKYSYIFNAGDILIGDEPHNITKEVLDAMNARYNEKK